MAKLSIPSNSLKRGLILAVAVPALAGILSFTVDLWTKQKLPFIEAALTEHLGRPVTVQRAGFGLLRGFMLLGVELKQNAPYPEVRIRRLSLMPSFRLSPPTIAIRRILVEDAEIILSSFPRQGLDAKTLIQNLSSELRRVGHVRLRADVRSFEVRGAALRAHRESAFGALPEATLWLSGTRGRDEIRLRASLECGPVKMKGSGTAGLKGDGHWHVSLSSEEVPLTRFKVPGVVIASGDARFYAAARGYGRHVQPSLEMRIKNVAFHDPKKRVKAANFAGQLQYAEGELRAREFWGFVNGVPVRLDLRGGTLGREWFYLELSTYPGQSEMMRSQHGGNAWLRIEAARSPSGWSGYIRSDKISYTSQGRKEDVTTVSFRALKAGECRFLRWRRTDGVAGALQDLLIRRAAYFLMANERYLQFEAVDLSLKKGRMRFRAQLRYAVPAAKASLSIENVDAAEWLAYLRHTAVPVTGDLSGTASWFWVRGQLRTRVEGRLENGRLGPDPRLEQWAKDTGISALREVRFRTAFMKAVRIPGGWDVPAFRLEGEALEIEAAFKTVRERIAGRTSVRIPRDSINASSDLGWLLRFVGAGEWVDFDFKVAGSAASPRVHWQGGEFKRKLETRLAPWMRHELARQVENRLKPAPSS